MTSLKRGEPSATIRERVEKAREAQAERFKESELFCNADMGPGEVRELCRLDEMGTRLMKSAMTQMSLSARAFHRVLKVGRTIADLAGEDVLQSVHLVEALQYRSRQHVVWRYIAPYQFVGVAFTPSVMKSRGGGVMQNICLVTPQFIRGKKY